MLPPVSEWLSLSWLPRELYPASFRNRVGNHFQLLAKEPNRREMPSGCYLYCIRSGVGRLSYKAHISAMNVLLPISVLFCEYLEVAGRSISTEERFHSFRFDFRKWAIIVFESIVNRRAAAGAADKPTKNPLKPLRNLVLESVEEKRGCF
jgi:hypothetical protein